MRQRYSKGKGTSQHQPISSRVESSSLSWCQARLPLKMLKMLGTIWSRMRTSILSGRIIQREERRSPKNSKNWCLGSSHMTLKSDRPCLTSVLTLGSWRRVPHKMRFGLSLRQDWVRSKNKNKKISMIKNCKQLKELTEGSLGVLVEPTPKRMHSKPWKMTSVRKQERLRIPR